MYFTTNTILYQRNQIIVCRGTMYMQNNQTLCISTPQVLNLIQSYVTLRVPLHVSYVFHSPVGAGGWQHFDLQSELRLTFVYDTAILWRDGIGSPPEAELQGKSCSVIYNLKLRNTFIWPYHGMIDAICK